MTGLTIRNTANEITLDMTSSISQNVSSVVTNGANGSVTIPTAPSGKTNYFVVVPIVDLQQAKGKRPGVTLSGTTLSWSYSFNTNGWGFFAANCRIYYGYY